MRAERHRLHHACEPVAAERHRARELHGRLVPAFDEFQEGGAPVGEGAAARTVGGAASPDLLERRSAVRGISLVERDVEQRPAVEHDGPGRAGMAIDEDLRDGCAVRRPVHVQGAVAERLPHGLEVIGGLARAVARRVRIEAGEAVSDIGASGLVRLGWGRRERALEGVRPAGPALVDEDDVPAREHVSPDARRCRDVIGRRPAWPAGEVGEGVAERLLGPRRKDDDPEPDLPPSRPVAVLRDRSDPQRASIPCTVHFRSSGARPGAAGDGTVEHAAPIARATHTWVVLRAPSDIRPPSVGSSPSLARGGPAGVGRLAERACGLSARRLALRTFPHGRGGFAARTRRPFPDVASAGPDEGGP